MEFIYDKEEEIPEEYFCTICIEPLYEPMEHKQCGNMFCEKCIKDLKNCPLCREELNNDNTSRVTIKVILNILNEIKVFCSKCNNKYNRDQILKHAKVCFKKCHQCHILVPPVDFQRHLENECQYRIVECDAKNLGCDWAGYRKLSKEHLEKCHLFKCKKIIEEKDTLLLKYKNKIKEKDRIVSIYRAKIMFKDICIKNLKEIYK